MQTFFRTIASFSVGLVLLALAAHAAVEPARRRHARPRGQDRVLKHAYFITGTNMGYPLRQVVLSATDIGPAITAEDSLVSAGERLREGLLVYVDDSKMLRYWMTTGGTRSRPCSPPRSSRPPPTTPSASPAGWSSTTPAPTGPRSMSYSTHHSSRSSNDAPDRHSARRARRSPPCGRGPAGFRPGRGDDRPQGRRP